ncbi:MAG: hypothetical protein EOO42_22025 [Flavobacteriales bacterium]|nr:MAG: hypothetical protein EOO42_22025 [Flavobacteriales bacterium]
MDVYVAVIVKHCDIDDRSGPAEIHTAVFKSITEAHSFVYDAVVAAQHLSDYEGIPKEEATKLKQKRRIVKDIIENKTYKRGDPEYEELFAGYYIPYDIDFAVIKQVV